MLVTTTDGSQLSLDKPFAEGGEAAIWSVHGYPRSVAKMFHKPTIAKEKKLTAMLASPPAQGEKLAVAWPTDLLYSKGAFVGYLMPRVVDSIPIFHVYNPARRGLLKPPHVPRYPWPYVLHHIAKNLAAAVKQVHTSGHVIGDLNESNVLVNSRAIVTLVDADSFQIAGGTVERQRIWPLPPKTEQEIHPNVVGKAEFTAPELHGVDFESIVRTTEHDNFAVAALIFYLLMDGHHPYAGVLRNQELSVGRVDLYCMKRGRFPYVANQTVEPPPRAPQYRLLHPEIRKGFREAFGLGRRKTHRRPTADQWLETLSKTGLELASCSRDEAHIYYRDMGDCPACETEAVPNPLIDSQAVARRLWQIRWALHMMATACWLWLGGQLRKGRAATSDSISNAVQDAGERSRDLRRRSSRWSLRDWAGRASHYRLLPTPRIGGSRRWVRWTVATISGSAIGLGLAWGMVAAADFAGLFINIPTIATYSALLLGFGMSMAQWPQLRRELTRFEQGSVKGKALGWVGSTTGAFLICGMLGDSLFGGPSTMTWMNANLAAATDGRNVVYWFLASGLLVGFVQSIWLCRYFARGRDRRRWTLVTTVGWVLMAYCLVSGWQWGAGQNGWHASSILGPMAGLFGYASLSGVAFNWIARGPLQKGDHRPVDHQGYRGLGQRYRRREPAVSIKARFQRVGFRWAKMLGLLGMAMFAIEQVIGWLIP